MADKVNPAWESDLSYRKQVQAKTLTAFTVRIKETDLMIHAEKDLSGAATDRVLQYRRHIESYIQSRPEFAVSLSPLSFQEPVFPIIREMMRAAKSAGVGPMAAVAGAIAQSVGMDLLRMKEGTPEVIVENGGDIFIQVDQPITVGIYAGKSPLSFKIGLRLCPGGKPLGVCTSSGTVGHSLSLGKADAVCVVSPSSPLADAAATAIGNRVRSGGDIQKGIDFGRGIEGVAGLAIIVGDKIGIWGDLDLIRI